jgi:hypothetical protein
MLGALWLQEPKHDIDVHQPECLMPEGFGQRARNGEPKFLVQLNSCGVRTYDVVELHRDETSLLSLGEAVLDKSAPYALFRAAGLTTYVALAT